MKMRQVKSERAGQVLGSYSGWPWAYETG